jgi:hypothetical protein
MRTIAVVLFFLLSIQLVQLAELSTEATTVYAFASSNATTVVNKDEFKFRSTNLYMVDVLGIGLAGVYYSASLDAMRTGQGSGTVSGDIILGAVKFIPGQIPITLLGYIAATANISLTPGGVASASFAAAGGFILHAALRLEERNPAGTAVRTVSLKACTWNVGGSNDSTGHLRFVTISPSFCFNKVSGETVEFVFFISDILGKVELGNGVTATVTPKTLESVVVIKNWNYADKANTLSLVYGTVTGAMAESGSVVAGTGNILTAGSGNNQVYAQYARTASINGASGNVVINHAAAGDISLIIEDGNNTAVLTAVYKGIGGVQGKYTTITFPAGASDIVYDPTIGSGDHIEDDAKTLLLSILLLVVFALL